METRLSGSISSPPLIRDAQPGDLAQVAAIFADVVLNTHYSFVLDAPDMGYWKQKLVGLDHQDAFLVALDADTDVVAGFAYSAPFRARDAYAKSRETTIYLAPGARGGGVGAALYAALLDRLEGLGNRLAVGVVAEPNPASAALHRRLGFEHCGTLPDVGEKFGRLWSTSFWARHLH
jgi:L-amino acid N-acyltransferase YncA